MRLVTKLEPLVWSLLLSLCVAFSPLAAFAQEHPKEHPKGGEHPKEHPKAEQRTTLTSDELADAITAWVRKESEKTGGKLEVKDTVQDKTLSLTLAKVHKDRLSTVAPETHFACADFNAEDGTVYDLDIFMKGPDKDHLEVTEVTVHKVNGKPRYDWYQEEGIWKKKAVEP